MNDKGEDAGAWAASKLQSKLLKNEQGMPKAGTVIIVPLFKIWSKNFLQQQGFFTGMEKRELFEMRQKSMVAKNSIPCVQPNQKSQPLYFSWPVLLLLFPLVSSSRAASPVKRNFL